MRHQAYSGEQPSQCGEDDYLEKESQDPALAVSYEEAFTPD